MDLELTGKVAIVTGASRGIGKAVAREVALEGADVAAVARGREALEATVAEIAAESGRRVLALTADTSDDASVQSMVQAAHEAFGRVDILVNNAASPGSALPPVPLDELSDDHVRADIEVKVLGYLRTARAVAPIMREQGWGRIVNISGLGARRSGNTSGSIRNVGVAALTKNLADELGPHGTNVTVVHPGGTRTERTAAMIAARVEAGEEEEAVERRLAEGNSIRHLVDAREVAYVVAFLASPKSISINGDAIATGGGSGTAIHY